MNSTVKMDSNTNSSLVRKLRRASHKVVKLSRKLHPKQQQQQQQQSQPLPKNLDPGKAAFFARNLNRQKNIEAKATSDKDNEIIEDNAVETKNKGNHDDILECYTIEIDNDHKYPTLKQHQLQQIAHSINNCHNSVVVVEDSKDDNHDTIVDVSESLEEYLLLMHKNQHKTTTTAAASTLGSTDGCSRSRTAASICSGSTAMVNNKTLQPGLVKASSEVRLRYQHYYRDAMSNLDDDTATLAATTIMNHAGLEYHPHILSSTAEEDEEEEKEEPTGFNSSQDSKQQLDTIIIVEQQPQYGKKKEICQQGENGKRKQSPTYVSVDDNNEEIDGHCGEATPCRVGFFKSIVCGAVVRPKSSKAALSGKQAKSRGVGKDSLAWLGSPIDDDDITDEQRYGSSSGSTDDEEEDNGACAGENHFVLESTTVADNDNPSCVPICAASVAGDYHTGADKPARLSLPQHPRKQVQGDEELVKKRWHKQFLQQSVKRMLQERNKTDVIEDSEEKKEDSSVSAPPEAVANIQRGSHDEVTNTFAAPPQESDLTPSSSIDVLLDVHLEVHSNGEPKRRIERSPSKEEKEDRMLNDILEQILPLEEPQYYAEEKKESHDHAPIPTSDENFPIVSNGNFANFDEVQVDLNFPAFDTPVWGNTSVGHHHRGEEKEGGVEFEAHGLLLEEPDGPRIEEEQKMAVQDEKHDSSMTAGNICRDLEELQDLRRPLEMAAAKLAPPPPPPLPSLRKEAQLQNSHQAKTEMREGTEGDADLVLEEAMQQVLDATFPTKAGNLDLRESTCDLARARGSIFDDTEGSVESEDAMLEELDREDEDTLKLNYGIFDDADGPREATEADVKTALPQMPCFPPAIYGDRPFDEITIGDPQFENEDATEGDDGKSDASTVSTLGLSVTMEPNDVFFKCIGVDISQAFMHQVDKCVDTLDVYPDEFDEESFGDTIGETIGGASYEKLLVGDEYKASF